MWSCPICETNNDDQRRICAVCGHERPASDGPSVILEPAAGSAPDSGRASGSRRYVSSDDAYSAVPSGNTREDSVKSDSASLWKKSSPNRIAMIIAVAAVIALAAGAIWYFTRPSAPLEVRIDVENADRIDGVWYVDDIIDITWTATRDDAVYNVTLLDGNGETLRYYENTSMAQMNLSRDIIADGESYALRVTAVDGKDTAETEIKIAAWTIVEVAETTEETVENEAVAETKATDEETAEGEAIAETTEETAETEESNEIAEDEPDAEAIGADWVVEFEDENLAQAIRDTLGIKGDITYGDLQELTELDASRSGIKNLDGIEYCTNLTKLYLFTNQISDISPLAELDGLSKLYLGGNRISDLTPLARLFELAELYLGSNLISDISPLAELYGLTELGLGSNQVSDVSPLSGLTSLETLYIDEDEIANMYTISHLDCEIN